MATWFKKFSYSTMTKIVALILLCITTIGAVGDGVSILRGISHEAYKDGYEETDEFLWDYLVPKAGYVRDWIVT